MGNAEYCDIQKTCDLFQKEPSGSLPLGTADLNGGFVPLAKPATAIETICRRVW